MNRASVLAVSSLSLSLSLCVILAFPRAAGATVWYVVANPNCSSNHALEFGTQSFPFVGADGIQNALSVASDGDEIRVEAGTYGAIVFPEYASPPIDVVVIAYDWTGCASGASIIDGTGGGSTGVSIYGGQTSATLFKGFTVQDWAGLGGCGIRIGSGETDGDLAQVNGYGCSPTIEDCIIQNNGTIGLSIYGGGGMQIAWHCHPTVVGCDFIGNYTYGGSTGYGGAIWIYGATTTESNCDVAESPYVTEHPDPWIEDCDFIENTATNTSNDAGGAIAITCGRGTIINCRFYDNEASHGGGAIYGHLCDGTLVEGCTFEGNIAGDEDGDGGAIYIHGKSDEDDEFESVHIIACEFVGNRADDTGGAIFFDDKDLTVSHSQFTENDGYNGGAAIWGEANRNEEAADLYLFSMICNLFWENTVLGLDGGGHEGREAVVYLKQSLNAEGLTCTAFNNTIVDNDDVRAVTVNNQADPGDGPILEYKCLNEILFFNSSTLADESIHDSNFANIPSQVTVHYTNAEQGVFSGSGNISSDPLFTTGYFLTSSSPCRNEGANYGWDLDLYPEVPDEDLDGATRIQESVIDMGCYEF